MIRERYVDALELPHLHCTGNASFDIPAAGRVINEYR